MASTCSSSRAIFSSLVHARPEDVGLLGGGAVSYVVHQEERHRFTRAPVERGPGGLRPAELFPRGARRRLYREGGQDLVRVSMVVHTPKVRRLRRSVQSGGGRAVGKMGRENRPAAAVAQGTGFACSGHASGSDLAGETGPAAPDAWGKPSGNRVTGTFGSGKHGVGKDLPLPHE